MTIRLARALLERIRPAARPITPPTLRELGEAALYLSEYASNCVSPRANVLAHQLRGYVDACEERVTLGASQ
jgi:hypothetical protein